jgi:ABC-type branched-subunit amino acid transport system ATPase component
LSLKVGTIYCIIGPNGAGKSTVLKVISGLLKPRDGVILHNGEPIHHLPPHERLKRGICFVPQEKSLFPDMSVIENLRMGGFVLGDRQGIEDRIEQVFAQFPILKEKRTQRAKNLSGGQQQMLALGRTLVLKPNIVMLDEPSLGLAPQIVTEVFRIIQQFRDNGMTILLVEQNAVKGLACADWGAVLDLGKNSFDGPADVILGDPRIQELYLGKVKAGAN